MPQIKKRMLVLTIVSLWLAGAAPGQPAQPSADAVDRYTAQGQQALAAGRYDEAARAFETLRELEMGVAELHDNLGAIYCLERKFEEAVPALRQALKLKPHAANPATLLAISLSHLGR